MYALPEIAERGKSFTEQQLEQNIKQLDDMMSKSFDKIHEKNQGFVDKLFEKPQKLEIEPDQSALDAAYAVTQAKVKESKDEAKKAKDTAQQAKDVQEAVSTKSGEITGLTSLADSIQQAASETKSVKINAQPQQIEQLNPRIQAPDEAVKELAAVIARKESQPKTAEEAIRTILGEIRDYFPQLINEVKLSGGVV